MQETNNVNAGRAPAPRFAACKTILALNVPTHLHANFTQTQHKKTSVLPSVFMSVALVRLTEV